MQKLPAGNGKVDLLLKCEEKTGLIEIKSYVDMAMLKQSKLTSVTMVLFVPTEDKAVLQQLSWTKRVYEIDVIVFPKRFQAARTPYPPWCRQWNPCAADS